MPSRYIHSRLSSHQVPDLLACIFVAELLTPSRSLWLVSPWISDIPIIDNSANTRKLNVELERKNLPYFIPRTYLIKPPSTLC